MSRWMPASPMWLRRWPMGARAARTTARRRRRIAAPGLINNSCCPVGNMIGCGSQACAVTGAPSSSAPTVVWIEVCTNRPAIAMTGPWSQSTVISRARLRAASAGAIGLPSAPSAAISASPGGLSWSKPSALRSMTSSQSSRLTVTVSVTRGFSGRVLRPGRASMRGPAGRRRGRRPPSSGARAPPTGWASGAAR